MHLDKVNGTKIVVRSTTKYVAHRNNYNVLVSALQSGNSTSRGDISGQLNFSTRSLCTNMVTSPRVYLFVKCARGAKVTSPKRRNKYVEIKGFCYSELSFSKFTAHNCHNSLGLISL